MVVEPIKADMETSTTSGGASLDMTLADIIKANKAKQKKTGGKTRGRGGARGGRGGVKRGGGQKGQQQQQQQKKPGQKGQLNLRGRGGIQKRGMRARGRGIMRGGRGNIQLSTLRAKAMGQGAVIVPGPAKLLISNLDKGVSDSDIYELFAEFGTINEAAVHYDRLGRSVSTAHVGFARHVDALKAQKQYNGVNLDGRPMHISVEAGGRGNVGGGQRMNVNFNQGFMGPMGGAVKRLQAPMRGMGMRGRGMVRGGMRGRGRGGYNMNVQVQGYGFNKNYNVGVGNRGRGRGGMRGGRGTGRGASAGRGAARGNKQGGRGGNRGNARGGRGAGRGNRGAGRGGKKPQQKKTPTVEELDAELDSYLNETA